MVGRGDRGRRAAAEGASLIARGVAYGSAFAALAWIGPGWLLVPLPVGLVALALADRGKWRIWTGATAVACAALAILATRTMAASDLSVACTIVLGASVLLPSGGAPPPRLGAVAVLCAAGALVGGALWMPAEAAVRGSLAILDPATGAGFLVRAWGLAAALAFAVSAWSFGSHLVRRGRGRMPPTVG